MVMLRVTNENKEPTGTVEDGGNVILSCSACGERLMDILISKPKLDATWNVRATCPYCGDKSYIQTIKGGYHYGGVGDESEDPEDSLTRTVVSHFEQVPHPTNPNDYVVEFVVVKKEYEE